MRYAAGIAVVTHESGEMKGDIVRGPSTETDLYRLG
jgi:hypothetical protein